MRYLSKIFLIAVTAIILTVTLAMAGTKFPNKDTAKNRQNNSFGTQPREERDAVTTIQSKKHEDNAIDSKRPIKKQEDQNENLYISVEPDIKIKK
jgi:uncharacterized protein YdeI (BOF family)